LLDSKCYVVRLALLDIAIVLREKMIIFVTCLFRGAEFNPFQFDLLNSKRWHVCLFVWEGNVHPDSLYPILKIISEACRGRPVKAEVIAERLGVKPQHVRNIARLLRELGVVKSETGPKGGYVATMATCLLMEQLESRQNVIVGLCSGGRCVNVTPDNVAAFVTRGGLYFYAEFVAPDLPIEVGSLVEVRVGESKFRCEVTHLQRRLGWTYELACRVRH